MTHRHAAFGADRLPLPAGPLTSTEALSLGWTRSAQRNAVRTGELVRVRRGVLAVADAIDASQPARAVEEAENLRAAQAAVLSCPRATMSHVSAAVAHGLPTYGRVDRPCLTVPKRTELRDLTAAHLHRAGLDAEQVELVDGFPVTTPARTVLDVAREGGVGAGLVAADFALRAAMVRRSHLEAELGRSRGWPGNRSAREVVQLADARSESVLESLSRLGLVRSGLPEPEPQVLIYNRQGVLLGRADFYWDELGVVGEADGDIKYRDDAYDAVQRQLARQELLERTGLVVVRWGWSDLVAFQEVVRRVRAAARDRRLRGPERHAWIAVPTTAAA